MAHITKLYLVPPEVLANRLDELEASVRLAFVRGLRRRGWTIEHAARECGASPSAVVKWISGKRRIPGSALYAVLGIGAANDNEREAA